MYTPKLFLQEDVPTLHALVRAHSFGTLVVAMPDGATEITHLPFVLDADAGPMGTLRAHVARANPIANAAAAGASMTAIFVGPHTYISPTWYETPAAQVPTWNYAAVHAHGHAAGAMTGAELLALLVDLSTSFEGTTTAAWSPALLESAKRDRMLQEIVGFAIPIERIDGKTKLSQNRSPVDHARVMDRLKMRGGDDDLEMIAMMERDPKRPKY